MIRLARRTGAAQTITEDNKKLMQTVKKCGTVSILGRPNVGKSTLLNQLIGEKVSIVSPKPQTTRNKITGVLTRDAVQMIFLDTPGLHKPRSKLGDRMIKTIYSTADDVDLAVLVAQADKLPGKPEQMLVERLAHNGIPCILALNKTDASKKDAILEVIGRYAALHTFAAVVPVSALTGDGCDALLDEIEALLPEGEHIFPDDALTDQPERVLAAELVREQLMRALYEEIPHGVVCETERFEEQEDGQIEIDVLIVCEKDSHKSIIIGRQGSMLKSVGTAARAEIEKMLDAPVFLKLWVKVKNDWRNNAYFLSELSVMQEQ